LHNLVTEHPTRGMIPNSRGHTDRDEKLNNTENEGKGFTALQILHNGDVEGRAGRKS
jgi:hypothetical protein